MMTRVFRGVGGTLRSLTGSPSPRKRFFGGGESAAILILLSVALLLMPLSVMAQTVTGSLSGAVLDASGAVVPGATVVLTDEATGSSQTVTTNSAGRYSYTAIFPGTYTVKVTAKGFSAYQVKGIVLHQQESRSVPDVLLKPGATAEEVTVNAETETVPIDTGASATTLNNTMVSQIAIQGRDAAELIRLMPGMAINNGLGNSEWSSALT